ncbi:DUF262 domain-containing protein [Microbacterium maritypicum]|uniref:GmrSD restriction endonuclease domain-containing protein n=1 Tax=Microbacterium TaxID=33882 RepID=UPI00141DD5D1|nr:DUF262 domain-containing protein [Microbacterium sp. Be9]
MAEPSDGQIEFEQLGIASVLKRHRLVVPTNQREYAWEEGHIERLFQDIARAITEGDSSYFLGTVVTIRRGPHLEVVDGQQRLATTALLIHAMANHLQGKVEMLEQALRNEFLFTVDRKQLERVPRLTLNSIDNNFFKAVITDEHPRPKPTKPSHELIAESSRLAKAQVRKIVATLDEANHGDHIDRWVTFLEEKAKVVLLIVSDDANAYRMFETLNDRGLRVSQADLVKNYLYGRAGDRLEEAATKWSLIRGTLEALSDEDALIDFLRHSLTVKNALVREADLYKKVESTVRSPHQVMSFANDLEVLAGTYVAIQNPEHEAWNAHAKTARQAIQVLSMFDIKPMRPLVLAVASRMPTRECDTALRMLVSLGVRLSIVGGTRSGSMETTFGSAAAKVYTGEITTAAALKRALNDIIPMDSQFEERFGTAKVINGKIARYYLRSLEDGREGADDPWWTPIDDPAVVNLEHVLPRKPMNNWPQFGTDVEANAFKTRLGNQALILADDNSRNQSDEFAAKKASFAASSYYFTKWIADAEEWTPVEIDERQRLMAKAAAQIWKV